MAALQRTQLRNLCSSLDTYDKAASILCLANAKTRPGSGFVVKNPIAIPAVCAYLASEQLNAGEVSLQSAMSAACVTQAEFARILKTIRAALHGQDGDGHVAVTYETLVDAYHVHPRAEAVACMEDAEAALPRVDVLRDTHGPHVLTCAVFYWVCQLMEEPAVQQRALCNAYPMEPKRFKAVVAALERQCGDEVAEQIRSHLLAKRNALRGSNLTPSTSRQASRSPTKSAMRPRTTRDVSALMLTPTTTPSKKRTVAFGRLPPDGDDEGPLPETPSKRRRVDASSSPDKSTTRGRASNFSAKRPAAGSTAAFYAALQGSPAKPVVGQEGAPPDAGPSTPRRPRHAKVVAAADVLATPTQASPSGAQGGQQQTPRRRRFRPVFLDQQQWCARDPKLERMWSALREAMAARENGRSPILNGRVGLVGVA